MSRLAHLTSFRYFLPLAVALTLALLLALSAAQEAQAQTASDGPLTLTVTDRTDSSITVQWSQVADAAAYTLILTGGDEFQIRSASPGEDTNTFTGLQADFQYRLIITAFRRGADNSEVQLDARTLPPPVNPKVSIVAGPDVTEGSDAVFTITADPAPADGLAVELTIAASEDVIGDGQTGPKTVTVPASGSLTYAVTTIDDDVVEANGVVTATLVSAADGYAVVDPPNHTATVSVTSEDRLSSTPTITIATFGEAIDEHGRRVTYSDTWVREEDGQVGFHLNLDPTPDKPLLVSLKLTQENDYFDPADLGLQRLLVPANASKVWRYITPIDDDVKDPNGKITLQLLPGKGYLLGEVHSRTKFIRDYDLTQKEIEEQKNYTPSIMVIRSSRYSIEEGGDFSFAFWASGQHRWSAVVIVSLAQPFQRQGRGQFGTRWCARWRPAVVQEHGREWRNCNLRRNGDCTMRSCHEMGILGSKVASSG